MSVTTSSSTSTTSQVYPNNTSDTQWVSGSSNHTPQSDIQTSAGETQQYRVNHINCNGSSGIYNVPKITHTNMYNGLSASGINNINGISNTNCIDSNINVHEQHYNLPNYASSSNGITGNDIRFQSTHNRHSNSGVMVSTSRVYVPYPAPSTSWASSGNRHLLGSRTTWSATKTTNGGVKKPKRIRTAFTSQQMMELENEYARARYLDRSRRAELSEVLSLNERTIKIWFQNRRMKEKKDKIESAEEAEATSTTEPIPQNASAPVIMYDPYPHNGIFTRDEYVEQYPVASSAMPMPPQNIMPIVQSGQNSTFNSYPAFIVDNNVQLAENFDVQYSEVNMGLIECHINDKIDNFKVEVIDSSPQPGTSSSTSDGSTNDFNGQNWDLSWIRSINMDDDF
ncbi:unnamed protein product, partial [Brenthis ino]